MMEEEDATTGVLGLTIGTTFSVSQEEDVEDAAGHDILIKQEPPEMLPPEVMEHDELLEGMHEPTDEEERTFDDTEEDDDATAQVFPEDSDIVMQRAVSPPTYVDPSEEGFQELVLFYKEKYQLKDVTVALENCDKIWETLQLIKNLQGFTSEEDSPDKYVLPKTLTSSSSKLVNYQPNVGNNSKSLPDFRFSVKSKKKLYHCITCGKEFVYCNLLHQHAIEEHGIYVSPKRIYKPRADTIAKTLSVLAADSNTNNININNDMETESSAPVPSQVQTIIPVQAMQVVETMHSTEPLDISNSENPVNPVISELKSQESVQAKVIPEKEKIKCVLCKRICRDIIHHIKNYHKVGCIKPIIAQCEKVKDSPETLLESSSPVEGNNSIVPKTAQLDLSESLVVAVKKRKRNMPHWSLYKEKKYKTNHNNIPIKNSNNGPFKCLICLDYFKTAKSFGYHKRSHTYKGETVENFDPSKTQFLNSSLKPLKEKNSPLEAVPTQKENLKLKNDITDHMNVQSKASKSEIINEDTNTSEGSNMEVDNDTQSERACSECGRSFRSTYTMFLHREKCKGSVKNTNDADSGLSISIKIKKNKNDSYEVVPRNTPIEENYNEPSSSKDSDASSNDSGMASVDYNNQKVETPDPSKFIKPHSILRIQVAEDDEEVDIEDDNSNDMKLNGVITSSNEIQNTLDPVTADLTENSVSTEKDAQFVKSFATNNNTVPSLTSLCKEVLSKSKQEQEMSTYRCETCKTYFKNKTELIDHAKNMNHDVKSHCPCGKDFKNLKYFNIHVRRFHPAMLKCSYCSTNFDRIEKYTEHKCNVTEGKLFIEPIIQSKCLQCKELVDLGEPFDKHMKIHMLDSKVFYHCFKCDLKFDNVYQRRMHFDKEHAFSSCRICSKFLHIDHLYKHEAYHDGLGHPCHKCRKAFPQKALLKKHIQNTHEPIVNEVIKCSVCSKSLKLKHLKRHISTHLHTEICKKCNKCFRSDEQNNLDDHVALDHPNDYPTLMCDICNISFISDDRYKEHCQSGSCDKSHLNKLDLVQNAISN